MGRDKKNERRSEHVTLMARSLMTTPAFRALSTTAKALYPFLKLGWKGPDYNNNGKIFLSVRQAAELMGVSRNTAAKAFHDLQAKGFIVVKEHGRLGLHGEGKAHKFELTEISPSYPKGSSPRRLYMQWKKGDDFPVVKPSSNNPSGVNGRRSMRKIKNP